MQIEKNAVAGTLESSDALVTVEPAQQGIELEISSSVMNQYGRQIRQTVLETLDRLDVKSGKVTVVAVGATATVVAAVEVNLPVFDDNNAGSSDWEEWN